MQVGEDVRKDEAGQGGVVQPCGEHLLHGLVGAVAGVRELVDRVPVAVLLHGRGAGGVLPAVQVAPVDERVERGGQIVRSAALGVLGRQLGDLRRDVCGVQEHLVVRPCPVEGAQIHR